MLPIPKKKKPVADLEPGEIANEEKEMIVTDEWNEQANEMLEQREHQVIKIVACMLTDSKYNYEKHRLLLSMYDYYMIFASRESDMVAVW